MDGAPSTQNWIFYWDTAFRYCITLLWLTSLDQKLRSSTGIHPIALPSYHVYWVRSRRRSTIENGNRSLFSQNLFFNFQNFLEAGNYPPSFGRILVPVFWFPYSGSPTLVLLLWFLCSSSPALVPLLWFSYSDSCILIPLLWFPYSDSSTGFKSRVFREFLDLLSIFLIRQQC
jgi:hypothetical protein